MLCIWPLYKGDSGKPSLRTLCASGFVKQVQQLSCLSCLSPSDMNENEWKSFSPSCTSMSSKCTLLASMRTGVPVFILPCLMPCLVIDSVRCSDDGSATLPPCSLTRPTCINPLRNVPAVTMTHFARMVTSKSVTTPRTSPSSTMISRTVSCQIVRLSVLSRIFLHSQMYFPLSHCALGLHMAGPLERFNILNCRDVLSVTMPMKPPKASISLTICPLAMPPTAGLQLIWAILFMSIVTRQVLEPKFAAAAAASHPACPPPMTITSYLKSIV